MTSILGFGAYLPRHRLTAASLGRKGSQARTLAGADEDALTLAVAAARNALHGRTLTEIDGLIFATASAPFGEKQCAAIAARALGLRADVTTFDITGSTRAGTQALHAAAAMVQGGRLGNCLVMCGDVRELAPGDTSELAFGDAGAAILVGKDGFARIGELTQRSNEMVDLWRGADERFVHGWENRFILDHGYKEQMALALAALGATIGAFDGVSRAAVYAPDLRSLRELAASAGLQLEKIVASDWLNKVGCTGASHALLQLCIALESAQQGERLLLANYGDGADAALIDLVAPAPAAFDPVADQLARGKDVSYAWYLNARKMLASEFEQGGELGNSATAHFRERDANLGLEGQVCVCGTHQFPKGRVCVRCGAVDQFAPRRYAEATAKIVTYSHDYFFPNPSPPTVITVAEVDDGPRLYMQITDADKEAIEIGTVVEFVFRRIHQVGNRPNYFWKCSPLRGEQK